MTGLRREYSMFVFRFLPKGIKIAVQKNRESERERLKYEFINNSWSILIKPDPGVACSQPVRQNTIMNEQKWTQHRVFCNYCIFLNWMSASLFLSLLKNSARWIPLTHLLVGGIERTFLQMQSWYLAEWIIHSFRACKRRCREARTRCVVNLFSSFFPRKQNNRS